MKHTGDSLRTWLTLPSTIGAAALLVVGFLFVGLEVQSPNWVYYTGDHVTGTVTGGIVDYKLGGQSYTQNDPRVPPPPDGTKVTVYYHAGDPESARLDQPGRWIDAAAMLVWFAAAALLLLVSAVRRSRRASYRPPQPEAWRR